VCILDDYIYIEGSVQRSLSRGVDLAEAGGRIPGRVSVDADGVRGVRSEKKGPVGEYIPGDGRKD